MKDFGILTAPVMGVISWVLFGVYQIVSFIILIPTSSLKQRTRLLITPSLSLLKGCSIEDPFQGSLRLSILCDAIYRDVMYDVDLKNKRDSAYQLEADIEWNRMGPIEDPSKLITPNGTSLKQEQRDQKEQNEQPASFAQASPDKDDTYSVYEDPSKLITPNGTRMKQEQRDTKEQNEQPASSAQAAPDKDDTYTVYDPNAIEESTLPSALPPKDPLLPRP